METDDQPTVNTVKEEVKHASSEVNAERISQINQAIVEKYGSYIPRQTLNKNQNLADRIRLVSPEEYSKLFDKSDETANSQSPNTEATKWRLLSEVGARYYATTVRPKGSFAATPVSTKDLAAIRFYGKLIDRFGADNLHKFYFGSEVDPQIASSITKDLTDTPIEEVLHDKYADGEYTQLTAENTEGFAQGDQIYIKEKPGVDQTSTITHEIIHLYEPERGA